jgi:hypothetical protein
MTLERERLDRFIGVSVFLHGALFALVFVFPNLIPSLGPTWGTPDGGSSGLSGLSVRR